MGENGLTSQEEAIALAFPGSFRQKELNKLKSVQNKDMQNGRPHKVFPFFPSFGSQFIHASDSDVFFSPRWVENSLTTVLVVSGNPWPAWQAQADAAGGVGKIL